MSDAFDMFTVTVPEAGSWWRDPVTGDRYQANERGYFEMINAGAEGSGESLAFKFADRPDLVPEDKPPLVVGLENQQPSVEFISDGEYIDLHAAVESYGHDLRWLLNRLQEAGVNLNEHEKLPGVFTPDPIPRAVRDDLMRSLRATPELPMVTWAQRMKDYHDRCVAHGISQHVLRAHTQPIITEHGKTQKSIDLINERLDVLIAGEVASQEVFGEPAPYLPWEKAYPPAIVNEDGEVMNIAEIYDAMGLADRRVLEKLGIVQAEQFKIDSPSSADWFVSRIRAMQDKADRIAEMAAAGIAEQLRYMQGMMYRYGQELKDYCVENIPLKKDGKPRQKNLKFTEGAVHFRKGGGCRISDYGELQSWVDSMPGYQHKYREALEQILELSDGGIEKIAREALEWRSPMEAFPITIVRKVDKRKIVKVAEQGAKIPGITYTEVRELAVMAIGGQRAWNIKKLKESLELKTDKYKLLTVDDDDIEGLTHEDEITDVDTN